MLYPSLDELRVREERPLAVGGAREERRTMTDYERFGEYQRMPDRGTVGIALTFLFVGLGLGALSALLLAPKSGKQMRRSLRRSYEDTVDRIGEWGETAGKAVGRGADWANTAKGFARDKVAPIARAVRRGE